MKKWNLIIDIELGTHFINSVLATKDEYVGNEHPGYTAPVAMESSDIMVVDREVRGDIPMVDAANILKTCNHCDDGACIKVGGDAVRKREDGIVIIDPVKAKGCKDLVEACPHDAIVWNEELQLPQNWIFDAHLLDQGWTKPRCVQSCATGAIEAVKITDEEMQRRVTEENLEVLHPELNTKPRVYYKNLYRINKCFIGGSVVADIGGVAECIGEAEVEIFQGDQSVGTASTDVFGEFKVDKLDPESGDYRVEVTHSEYGKASVNATLGKSCYLGEIRLNS